MPLPGYSAPHPYYYHSSTFAKPTMIDKINYGFDCMVWDGPDEKQDTPQTDANFNHTLLYSYIKWRRWDAALDRITHFPQEASKWIFDRGDDGGIEKYLPLHRVCRETTRQFLLVETLINVYPDAVRQVDHMGRVPLHHFCLGIAHNHTYNFFQPDSGDVRSIIDLLLSVYPEGIYARDVQHQATPMKIITDAINRKGRTVVTDAIVSALTRCHCVFEQQTNQKEATNSPSTSNGSKVYDVKEIAHCTNNSHRGLRRTSPTSDPSLEGREETGPIHAEQDGSVVPQDKDSVSSSSLPSYFNKPICQTESNKEDVFEDAIDDLKVNEVYAPRDHVDEIPISANGRSADQELGEEYKGEKNHKHDSTIWFARGKERVMQAESLKEEVITLKLKLSELEVAHFDAIEKMQVLNKNEVVYKAVINALQTELYKHAKEVAEHSELITDLSKVALRMKSMKDKDSRTINELQNQVARSALEIDAYEIAVEKLKTNAKQSCSEAANNVTKFESCQEELFKLREEGLILCEKNKVAASRELHLESRIQRMQEKLKQIESVQRKERRRDSG